MNRRKAYRVVIVSTLVALTGLLVVQVYWFVKAYDLHEKQFDEKVNLALRDLSSQLLTMDGDSTSRIDPVTKTSSNSYYVDFNNYIDYHLLDSLLKTTFPEYNLLLPFEVVVYEERSMNITLGAFYKDGVASKAEPTCLERTLPKKSAMDFAIIFPGKKTEIVGGLGIWIFSAFTFLAILVLFGFVIIDLSKQKKLAEVKADFINNMTHELQTPIANISIASEVLRKAGSEISQEKAAHYANIVYIENERLKSQVEQVLQTARLEKGELSLKKDEVDLHSIIEEVIRNFQVRVQTRHGQIKSKLEALKPFISGDRLHLANMFYNLLDNADKYSPLPPDITITTNNLDDGVVVTIADKGVGMSRDVQRYIFDKFYRASGGDVHDVKGFGLGLTYVREIVKAHQGKVSVSSEVNRGSRFELHFQNT